MSEALLSGTAPMGGGLDVSALNARVNGRPGSCVAPCFADSEGRRRPRCGN
jgi:hypothetical protein